MSKTPGKPGTRTASDYFLVGQGQSDLGNEARQGKLPLTKDVMKYFLYRKNMPEYKFKPVDLAICCPLKSGTKVSKCNDSPNCNSSTKCVVRKVKEEGNWICSGIPIMSDFGISSKLKKLYEEHRAISKNKKKPLSDLIKREEFSEKLDEMFDISIPGVEDRLEGDRLRDQEARDEDIRFLRDQKDPDSRKMCVGKARDEKYGEAVKDKVKRDTRTDRMALETNDKNNNIEFDKAEDDVLEEEETEDYVPPQEKKKKSNLVTLVVDRKRLAKETSITAKRHRIGVTAQRDMLANVINIGGGDIAEFSLSKTTVRNAGIATVREDAEKVKEDFKKVLVEDLGGKECIIIYFDGKALAQFHDKIKSVKKRISVVAASPDLPSEQVLGVPFTPSNSGKDQKVVVMEQLVKWELEPFILGLAFDTTSDNTGKNKGAVVLIEKALGRAVWWVACPHHFYELHVKKAARFYFGETACPEETTYKRLKDGWNKIVENGIDYEDLELFDWEQWDGTFLAERAYQVLAYLQSLREKNTFPREDLKELLSLVLMWLGYKVENFRFQYPGAMSHARFLMQSIYSMKIFLLSRQLDIYSAEELEEIKSLGIFVGLFHAPWYFQCPLASTAPMLHLSSIHQMKKLKSILPDLAEVILESISLHLWYLTPQSIPLALTDENLSADQRSWIATGLSSIPRMEVLPMGKPTFPNLSTWSDKLWAEDKLPELSTMLGPESWLLFNKLGMGDEDLDWLQLDPLVWELKPGYVRFRDFVKRLTIVNDPAERGVGLIKQFISTFQNEQSCQENLLAVSKHRKIVNKNSRKEDLANIGINK